MHDTVYIEEQWLDPRQYMPCRKRTIIHVTSNMNSKHVVLMFRGMVVSVF
jgi:hypothetical protein